VQRFLEEFPRRVAFHGKAAGITFGDFDSCKRAHAQGYRFINFGNILSHGATALAADLQRLKKAED